MFLVKTHTLGGSRQIQMGRLFAKTATRFQVGWVPCSRSQSDRSNTVDFSDYSLSVDIPDHANQPDSEPFIA